MSDTKRRSVAVVYVQPNGAAHRIEVREGVSLMEAALRASIPGIEAKCRGNCACVTCHVFIDPVWKDAVGERGAMEDSMLDFAEGADHRSRLSCQVRVNAGCDGMTVHVPSQQRVIGV